MRLEPLYRVRFTYPESWAVGLDGGWQQMFFIAEARCEGSVTGRFRGVNFPGRKARPVPSGRTSGLSSRPTTGRDQVERHGYGRAYPPERRQIVGSVFHLADREPLSPAERCGLRLHRRGPRTWRSSSDRNPIWPSMWPS
jgi:hypothetical protein